MKRQRNTTQMKEQVRNTEVQINEEETGKPSEKEFRIIIGIQNNNRKDDKKTLKAEWRMQESINKDLE